MLFRTIQYHSAIKRNEVLIHTTTWMNFKDFMLSKRNQSLKATYYMIPFNMKCLDLTDLYRQKVDQWFPGAGGRGQWGVAVNGRGVSLWDDEIF